jgi:tetratricopeptide (TPR) repeat protein
LLLSGCNETHAIKKQAMVSHWEKSTAQAKLPAAEAMIDRGELGEAKTLLNKCLAAAPELPQVHLLVGRIHFIEGRTENACQSFLKAVELDSQFDKGWYYLGSLAVLDNNYPLAMEHYQKALQLQPGHTEYIISVSELYIEMGQHALAREILEAGLSKQPGSLDLMLEMARLYQRSGEEARASEVYEQAQLIHGNVPQILEPSGYGYMAQGQWARAAEKFELLQELNQQNPEHHQVTLRSLAVCSFNAENFGRALACYDTLSGIYRDDPEIWLGMAQSALGLGDTTRAIRCAEKTLQLEPSRAKAYAVLGSAQYMKGDYERSLAAFSKITGHEDYAAIAWFMSGRCYRQTGQIVQAEKAFEKAEQLNPDNELIRMYLKKTLKFL